MTVRWTVGIASAAFACCHAAATVAAQEAPDDDATVEQTEAEVSAGAGECASWRVTGPAEAPSRKQLRKAARAARKAARSCTRKRWKQCASGYESAYQSSGDSEHLRGLGMAHEGAGDPDRAICVYQQFVATSQDVNAVAEVATQVEELRVAVAEDRRKQAELQARLDQAAAMDCSAWAIAAPADKPTRKAKREARKQASIARRQCKEREYDACVESWKAAYGQDGDHRHLAALADSYLADEKHEAALCTYMATLSAAPDDDNTDQLKQTIATMHASLEQEQQRLAEQRNQVQKASSLIDCAGFDVQAPTGNVTTRHRRKARTQFKNAEAYCELGEFEKCRDALQEAFKLDGALDHLRGLAYVYEQLKREEGAICSYRQILASNPGPELVEVAEKKLVLLSEKYNEAHERKVKVVELEGNLDETKAELTKTAETLEKEAKQREQVEKKAESLETELSEVETESEQMKKWIKVQGRSTKGSLKRHFGTALLGLGSLGVGFGVLYGLQAQRASSDLSNAKEWNAHFDKLIDEGKADNTRAIVLTSVGAASLIAGGVLYYLGEMASRNVELEVEVDSSGAPAGASLWLGGSF